MYCEFYQLRERPFNITPDPKFLYLNARYREAIASLNYGIAQRKGFITLIGEAGTGKTTLLKKLLEDLDPKTRTVFIFNTNVTFEEILEYIFAEFDLPVLNGKKLYMLQRLNAFLLEELRNGGNVALLIDEAQDLEFSVLEDLRLLSNLETAKEKILQIVLSGQPELGQKLSSPVLRQLRQRIGINCRLPPLSRDELTEYIQCRLEATDCPDLKLFSREAEDQIYRFSRGIPRLINVVSDNALVIGYALGRKRIGAEIITEAASDLMAVEPQLGDFKEQPITVTAAPAPEPLPSPWRARLAVSGVVLVVALVGLLSVGRTMLNKHAEEQIAEAPAAPARLELIRPGSEPRGTGVGYHSAPGGAAVEPPGAAEVAIAKPIENEAPAPSAPVERREGEAKPVALAKEVVALPKKEVAPPKEVALPKDIVLPKDEIALAKKKDLAPSRKEAALAQKEAVLLNKEAPVKEAGQAKKQPVLPEVDVALAKKDVAPPQDIVAPKKEVVLPAVPPKEEVAPAMQEAVPEEKAVLAKKEPAFPKQDEVPSSSIESALGGNSPRLDGVQFTPVVAHDGDSISTIAQREYGQASYTILDLLKLANPDLRHLDAIAVGETIRLPLLSEGFPILSDGSSHYALLVFSTPQQRRAVALQNALRNHGFRAGVTAGSAGLGKPLYRVVVPGVSGRDEVVGIGKQVQKVFREDKRLAQLGE